MSQSETAASQPVLTFRDATAADIEELLDLIQSAYRGESSQVGWTTEAHLLDGQRTDAEQLQALIDRPGARILLGCDDTGTVLGCCQLEVRTERLGYFGTFAVRPTLQGNGIGAELMAEAERLAREQGCTNIELTVLAPRVDLIGWYQRKGYALTGQTQEFPYHDERFGLPRTDDLYFVVLRKPLATAQPS